MRQAIKELPHTLVLHLKRFEWDFETETRFKKKDRFEFPLHLDMFRYTLEGLAEAEAASIPSVRSLVITGIWQFTRWTSPPPFSKTKKPLVLQVISHLITFKYAHICLY